MINLSGNGHLTHKDDMTFHNYSPYEKMLEMEVHILHLQQNQDELIRQHRNLSRTVEQLSEHLTKMAIYIQEKELKDAQG